MVVVHLNSAHRWWRGDTIAKMFEGTSMSPILLAYCSCSLMISLGSATVAAVSTTGIVLPLLEHSDVNVALVVLAIVQVA